MDENLGKQIPITTNTGALNSGLYLLRSDRVVSDLYGIRRTIKQCEFPLHVIDVLGRAYEMEMERPTGMHESGLDGYAALVSNIRPKKHQRHDYRLYDCWSLDKDSLDRLDEFRFGGPAVDLHLRAGVHGHRRPYPVEKKKAAA